MRLHPQVAKIIKEATGETKIPVKVYAPNPTGARGFFPERNHPNLAIEFKPVGGGKHIDIGSGRATHVQYAGEHFGGTANQAEYAAKKRCLIISAIGSNFGGRYTAVALDYIAKNGGKLMGEGYFSWQGQGASGGDREEIVERFFRRMNSLFGLLNHRIPNDQQDADLFLAAGLPAKAKETLPEVIKDHPDLLPATKVLQSLGVDLNALVSGNPFDVDKLPVDLTKHHTIQKALDDLKDAKLIDYDLSYRGPKISKITIMRESVDLDQKVAILSNMTMKNRDVTGKQIKTKYGPGLEIVYEGITFQAFTSLDGDGDLFAVDNGKVIQVGVYESGEMPDKIRATAKKIKATSILEVCKAHAGLITG